MWILIIQLKLIGYYEMQTSNFFVKHIQETLNVQYQTSTNIFKLVFGADCNENVGHSEVYEFCIKYSTFTKYNSIFVEKSVVFVIRHITTEEHIHLSVYLCNMFRRCLLWNPRRITHIFGKINWYEKYMHTPHYRFESNNFAE